MMSREMVQNQNVTIPPVPNVEQPRRSKLSRIVRTIEIMMLPRQLNLTRT